MKRKKLPFILLINILLAGSVQAINNQCYMEVYPATSYVLSEDGKTLMKWTGPETVIDMNIDSRLAEVTTINYMKIDAWDRTSPLESVVIGNKVATINSHAFNRCSKLTSVTFPNNGVLKAIMQYVFSETGLTSIVLPEGVSLGTQNNIFTACSQLKTVTFPNSVTSIPTGTFANCTALTDVVLGNAVVDFSDRAFQGCTALKNFTIGTPEPPSIAGLTYLFYNVNLANVNLHVPPGSLTKYRAAEVWKDFAISTSVETNKILQNVTIKTIDNNLQIHNRNDFDITLEIYTLSGQKLYHNRFSREISVTLEKGIYLIKLDSFISKIII